jgi:hypothetical protein
MNAATGNKPISLLLSLEECKVVMLALGKLPAEITRGVMNNIDGQVSAVIASAEEPKGRKPKGT